MQLPEMHGMGSVKLVKTFLIYKPWRHFTQVASDKIIKGPT